MNIETGLVLYAVSMDKDENLSQLKHGREAAREDELAKRRRWTFGGWAMSTILSETYSSSGGGGRQRISAIIRPGASPSESLLLPHVASMGYTKVVYQ